jgi:hypothetical protein
MLNKDGAIISKQFKANNAIGQIGEKGGRPLASDGMIGKNSNPCGAIGGPIHANLGKVEMRIKSVMDISFWSLIRL